MDRAMWEVIGMMTSVSMLCLTGLVGYWLTLRHRRRLAELQRGDEEVRAELEELKEDTALRFNELNERLDFAERLLVQGGAEPAPERKHPTPA